MLSQKTWRAAALNPAAIKLLLYLLDRREANLTQMVKEARLAWTSIYRALKILKQYDLIYEHRHGKAWIITLTSRGFQIAKKLKEIEELLKP